MTGRDGPPQTGRRGGEVMHVAATRHAARRSHATAAPGAWATCSARAGRARSSSSSRRSAAILTTLALKWYRPEAAHPAQHAALTAARPAPRAVRRLPLADRGPRGTRRGLRLRHADPPRRLPADRRPADRTRGRVVLDGGAALHGPGRLLPQAARPGPLLPRHQPGQRLLRPRHRASRSSATTTTSASTAATRHECSAPRASWRRRSCAATPSPRPRPTSTRWRC